jgi:hypothetical protein
MAMGTNLPDNKTESSSNLVIFDPIEEKLGSLQPILILRDISEG